MQPGLRRHPEDDPVRETPVKPETKWGMLTVVKPVDKNESSQMRWEALCECGNTAIVWGYNLVKGKTVSCGCMRRRNGVLVPRKTGQV